MHMSKTIYNCAKTTKLFVYEMVLIKKKSIFEIVQN